LNNDSPNDWLKFWSENQKTLFQAWVEGKPPPGAFRGEPPPMGDAMKQSDQLSDLMRETMCQWANLSKEAWSQVGRFDTESMKKLFDPAEWKRAGSHFDMGLEKLTEGPTYATLWDLDKKMLNVQKLWMERARDVEQYWEVVQGAWTRALDRFMKTVNDSRGEPITKGRQMLAESGIATQGAHILVVGVTYKPDVADVRESPAVEIVDELIAAGAAVEYTDSWVDHLETPHGTLMSQEAPEQVIWDLVLVHTRHANVDLGWLAGRLVLDATYRS